MPLSEFRLKLAPVGSSCAGPSLQTAREWCGGGGSTVKGQEEHFQPDLDPP